MIKDLAFLLGLGLIGAGCWWVYPPAALIVVGALLLITSIVGHFYGTPRSPAG